MAVSDWTYLAAVQVLQPLAPSWYNMSSPRCLCCQTPISHGPYCPHCGLGKIHCSGCARELEFDPESKVWWCSHCEREVAP